MDSSASTWIVMIRDVSHAVRVQDQPRVIACLILDAGTGRALGAQVATTVQEAAVEAVRAALTTGSGSVPPAPPALVACVEHTREVRTALEQVLGAAAPRIHHGTPVTEAEDIFDSFVGHMAGRSQPVQPPAPPDWQALYTHIRDYRHARPWLRRSDAEPLRLRITVDGASSRYLAVVMGQAGIQRGLALYPGAALPAGLEDWTPGDRVRTPAGTLLLWLDPPDEVPAEHLHKARRYGWPHEADLVPLPLAIGPDGAADLDRRATRHLILALAAVVDHDLHPGAAEATTGKVPLPDGATGTYEIG